MKTKLILAVIVCFIPLTPRAQVPQLLHYQGRIVSSGTNFNGVGEFKFALLTTNQTNGTMVFWSNDSSSHLVTAEPATATSLSVSDGLYSVLLGDTTLPGMRVIPATVFTNPDVRLRVWFSPGSSGFEQLVPDQRIAAVGYAMMAGTAATVADGGVTATKLAGNAVTRDKIASGQVVKSLNALKDEVVLAPGANIALATNGNTLQISASGTAAGWNLNGNSGTTPDTQFLGTTDRKRLDLRVNSQTAVRLEPTVITTTGPGGIQTVRSATPNVIAGYSGNLSSNGIVGAAIAGGGSSPSPVSGGQENVVGGDYSAVGGGLANQALGDYATVPGGAYNTAAGRYALAAGRRAKAQHDGSFVWSDSTGADFTSSGSNQFLVRASGGMGVNTTNLTGDFTLRSVGEFPKFISFQNVSGQEVASIDGRGNLTAKNQPFVKYAQGRRGDFNNWPGDYPACTNFTICKMDVDAPSAGVLVIHGHVELAGVARAGSGACGPPNELIPPLPVEEALKEIDNATKDLNNTISDIAKKLSDLTDVVSKITKPATPLTASSVTASFLPFSRAETKGGRFGLGLFRSENGTETALSFSGREYDPDLFRGFTALSLEVSWVLPVSEGQRTRLRLAGSGGCHQNPSDGLGIEAFNLTATYFPRAQ